MSMETLPVEIFHRIFDHLDAQILVLSVRSVCRLFRAVVHSYDRYVLDFKSMSKSDFHVLCRLIAPQNIRSLTLSDADDTPDQIGLFLSLLRVRQLNRLHSLTLSSIEELQLNMIFKRLNLNLLHSFSLNIDKYDDRRKKTTLHNLSLILGQAKLKKVHSNIRGTRVSDLSWPLNSRIEYLSINGDVSFQTLCHILSCSSQLRTLKMKGSLFLRVNKRIETDCFDQLISLTLEDLDVNYDQLESFLRLTPSLRYLKLIGHFDTFNGKQWEEFCQINLPQLNRLQFFIDIRRTINQTQEELNRTIEPFRSSFWIEYQKWFVGCEFQFNEPYRIGLYSLPICQSVLDYQIDSEKNLLCNSSISWNDHSSMITTNVNELHLSLEFSMNNRISNEKCERRNIRFPNVTKLSCDIARRANLQSIASLFSTIDICKLVQVKLESYSFSKTNQALLFEMITLLEQAFDLRSLIIHSRFAKYEMYPFLHQLYSIIPSQIKHLQIPIEQIGDVEILLQQCPYLLMVKFDITRVALSQQVIQWFTHNTINSTFRRRPGCDTIWIGKRIKTIEHNPKRMKFTDDLIN